MSTLSYSDDTVRTGKPLIFAMAAASGVAVANIKKD